MQDEVYKLFIGRYETRSEVNAIMPENFASLTPPYPWAAYHEGKLVVLFDVPFFPL
jgi:hypothetical protein